MTNPDNRHATGPLSERLLLGHCRLPGARRRPSLTGRRFEHSLGCAGSGLSFFRREGVRKCVLPPWLGLPSRAPRPILIAVMSGTHSGTSTGREVSFLASFLTRGADGRRMRGDHGEQAAPPARGTHRRAGADRAPVRVARAEGLRAHPTAGDVRRPGGREAPRTPRGPRAPREPLFTHADALRRCSLRGAG
jgi:hypothetical protein